MEEQAGAAWRSVKWTGLVAGPLLAGLVFAVLPESFRSQDGQLVPFTSAARATLAVMVWMGTWWLTEAIDLSATALLPLAIFPPLGIASMAATAAPYADELIFLFMGGFLLALSMERWGLDRRIALLTLRLVGTRPANMVGGFMLATALISAFVSNTATTAMMLPIGLSVVGLVLGRAGPPDSAGRHFAVCLMLGIAYAASIGGVATIIGTPPNAFLVGFVREGLPDAYRREISFVRWLGVGVPLAAAFLPLAWLLLTRVLYPVGGRAIEGGAEFVRTAQRDLGPMKRGEWVTLVVFALAALAWISRPLLSGLPPLANLSDAGIAMGAALMLFLVPVRIRPRQFALNWETATRLPFGILILFGGGLSLAAAVKANGVDRFFASLAANVENVPPLLVILAVTALVVFLSELTSNTATTAAVVPILAAAAPGLGLHPLALIVPATLAASCAFMMPVGTPPNAMVFASGHVSVGQMCKAGLWLNLIGIVLITALVYAVVLPVLGVSVRLGG